MLPHYVLPLPWFFLLHPWNLSMVTIFFSSFFYLLVLSSFNSAVVSDLIPLSPSLTLHSCIRWWRVW